MRRATRHHWRIAIAGLGVTLMVVAIGFAVLVNAMRSDDPPPDNGVDTVLGDATGAAALATSPAASPSPTPSPTPTPARDQTPPNIGEAVTEVTGIWTDYWCSAGPTRSQIQIPVADPTDPVEALQVVIRFVLRRGDNQATADFDEVRVTPSGSPVVFTFGPYPGPNAAYAYDNTIDMVVNATDPAGNISTRRFINFMTFNDCKAG